MTPAGIETATFRFVAEHLNHCATAVPHPNNIGMKERASHTVNISKRIGGLIMEQEWWRRKYIPVVELEGKRLL
jgi:hypothetical protein